MTPAAEDGESGNVMLNDDVEVVARGSRGRVRRLMMGGSGGLLQVIESATERRLRKNSQDRRRCDGERLTLGLIGTGEQDRSGTS